MNEKRLEQLKRMIDGLIEYNFENEWEELNAVYMILTDLLEKLYANHENNNDIKTFNTLTTMQLQLEEIIKEYENKGEKRQ